MSDRQFKPTFAPVPMRAFRDKELSKLQLTVLAAIAMHDRLNSNRQGCWAGNARLAEIAGCHLKSVPRAITALIKKGYVRNLEQTPGKQRSRVRFLSIVYTQDDGAGFQDVAADRPVEKPAAATVPAPAEPREGNRAVTLKVTELGYPKRTGRNSAEAEVGSAKGDAGRPPRPFRPPEPGRNVVAREVGAKRDAARQCALLLGNGDLTKGWALWNKLPDAERRECADA